jgi:hypothetical protein
MLPVLRFRVCSMTWFKLNSCRYSMCDFRELVKESATSLNICDWLWAGRYLSQAGKTVVVCIASVLSFGCSKGEFHIMLG